MKAIPVFRAAHLGPHIAFLHSIGAPIESEMIRAKLPLEAVSSSTLYVPLACGLRFLEFMRLSQGVEDLPIRAVHKLNIESFDDNYILNTRTAPTLLIALQRFCNRTGGEANYVDFWIDLREGTSYACSRFNYSNNPILIRHSEWSQLYCQLITVRAYLGQTWTPKNIIFQSSMPVGNLAESLFPNCKITTGGLFTSFSVPTHLLSTPANHTQLNSTNLNASLSGPIDFISSLERLLRSYVSETKINISDIATMLDISSRTLQRELNSFGETFMQLKQKAQYEHALELLNTTDMKILEIAQHTGYDDSSNFTRAFKRLAGVTPTAYRKNMHEAIKNTTV